MSIAECQFEQPLPAIKPVAIIDIGSNSVRLVIYENLTRSPMVLLNEKRLCGLGRGLASRGQMAQESIECAFKTLRRYRKLIDQVGAKDIYALATAAVRDATNGLEFIESAECILGCKLNVLTGKQEAKYAAFGIMSGFYAADGIVGDLGGGSLELVDIKGHKITNGITLALGGLRLQEQVDGDIDQAREYVKKLLLKADVLKDGKARIFYAVGGTWRSIARYHMDMTHYPMRILQGYEIGYQEMISFLDDIIMLDEVEKKTLKTVSKNRQILLPFGAVIMQEILKKMQPLKIVFSALGVREGFLYSLLDKTQLKSDALIEDARKLSHFGARSPSHAQELVDWTGKTFPVFGIVEKRQTARYRIAACLLADIRWGTHPDCLHLDYPHLDYPHLDYRGRQVLELISNGEFLSVSHSGCAYIALTNYYRHQGLNDDDLSSALAKIATDKYTYQAKLLGGFLRILYLFSASMPGIIPKLTMKKAGKQKKADIYFCVPKEYEDFIDERLCSRIRKLEKLTDKKIEIKIG